MLTLSKRVLKEILRDPLMLAFGLGFPLILLFLMSAIQTNIPVDMFEISHLSPGVAVFGLSFMSLFTATVIAKDRESAFIYRLYTAPLRVSDILFSYILPMLPIALAQGVICYICALILGLKFGIGVIFGIFALIPVAVFYISLGVLFGSILTVKQTGGICGALLVNLSAWLSGVWFDISLVGGVFEKAAYFLPFIHSVELARTATAKITDGIILNLAVVIGYTVAAFALAVFFFTKQRKKQ